ncbi:MAG: hypothetical protein AAF322_03210 [Pseudomonadota bacterium]
MSEPAPVSPTAELALARVLAGRPAVVFSPLGLSSPLAAAAALRVAARPSGGLLTRPFAAWAPPLKEDEAPPHLLEGRTALLDARFGSAPGPTAPPDLIRAGEDAEPAAGFRRIFGDEAAGEAIWSRDDRAAADLALLSEPGPDEFDALAALAKDGALAGLRHRPGRAEALLDPASILVAPERWRIDLAIGEGRAAIDPSVGASLAVPRLSARQGAFALLVIATRAPTLAGEGLRSAVRREGPFWRIDVESDAWAEADLAHLTAPPPEGAPFAEIVEVAVPVRRRVAERDLWAAAVDRAAREAAW